MGYALAYAACGSCGTGFSFNPTRVPSYRRTPDGPRLPVCLVCVTAVNLLRTAKGLEPIVPLPGAYEACDESELGD